MKISFWLEVLASICINTVTSAHRNRVLGIVINCESARSDRILFVSVDRVVLANTSLSCDVLVAWTLSTPIAKLPQAPHFAHLYCSTNLQPSPARDLNHLGSPPSVRQDLHWRPER